MKENLMSPIATLWDIEKKYAFTKHFMSSIFTDEVFNISKPFDDEVFPAYNLIVTGSILFPLHGIDLHRPIEDLDVIVVCSEAKKMQDKFIELCKLFPERMHRTSEYFEDSFYYASPEVKINFCITENNPVEVFNLNHVVFKSIDSVIAWKLHNLRKKDILDLEKLASYTEYLKNSCGMTSATYYKLKKFLANPKHFCELIDEVKMRMNNNPVNLF